jgi:hypothetical protein
MDLLHATWPQLVICLGDSARLTFAESSQGRVLAVFSKAVYLMSEPGRLVWLTTEQAPMHRRAIRFGGPPLRPSVGSIYTVSDQRLRLDDGSVFDWRRARVWRPPRPGGAAHLSRDDLGSYLRTVRPFVDGLPAPRGFGVLIAPTPAMELAEGDRRRSPALQRALPPIRGMADAWRAGDRSRILACAEDLLGLGEGLTPSGDDFVGAMLFAAVNLDAVDVPTLGFSPSTVRRFLTRARQRTNLISYALLHDHAVGHASEALHRLLGALLRGDSIAVISRLATDVIRIGHSTGWDLLAGLWMALSLGPAGVAHRSRERSPGLNLA